MSTLPYSYSADLPAGSYLNHAPTIPQSVYTPAAPAPVHAPTIPQSGYTAQDMSQHTLRHTTCQYTPQNTYQGTLQSSPQDTYQGTLQSSPQGTLQSTPNTQLAPLPEWTTHFPPAISRLLQHSESAQSNYDSADSSAYVYIITESSPDGPPSTTQSWGPFNNRHTANFEAAKQFVHRYWNEAMVEKRQVSACLEEGLLSVEMVVKVGGKNGAPVYGRVVVKRERRHGEGGGEGEDGIEGGRRAC